MNEHKYPLVTHARDSRFLALRSLQTPQGRSRTGLYIIEGIRHLARAVEHNAPIESVFLEPSVLSNAFGQKLARRLRKRGIPSIRLSQQLYRGMSLAAEPQGIGAVLGQQWTSLQQLRMKRNSLWLAVESDRPGRGQSRDYPSLHFSAPQVSVSGQATARDSSPWRRPRRLQRRHAKRTDPLPAATAIRAVESAAAACPAPRPGRASRWRIACLPAGRGDDRTTDRLAGADAPRAPSMSTRHAL